MKIYVGIYCYAVVNDIKLVSMESWCSDIVKPHFAESYDPIFCCRRMKE